MTDLIPTPHEVVTILRETGALRIGHFQLTSGIHT
ncbi:MAG: phosphoribosyltransferase, partial [Bryobacterales bacterium]|nr:phosphoribosyltransferase [Bryobacterales bacterium]